MNSSEALNAGEGAKPSSRATMTANHRGYHISATASRRITGAMLVNAELSGGPDRIRRWFCIASDAQDLVAACEQCIRELCNIIDDISSGSQGAVDRAP